jgi:hypothetical protein
VTSHCLGICANHGVILQIDEKKPTPTGIVVVAAIGVTLAIFSLGFAIVYIRRRRANTNSQGYELTGRPATGNVVNASDGTPGFVPL